MVLGVGLAAFASPPDILINDDGSMVALRTPQDMLALNTARGSRITRETWLERNAQGEKLVWPDDIQETDWLSCDERGCVYRRAGHDIALSAVRSGIADDCAMADMVIAPFPLPDDCQPRLGTIDRFDVWREGPHVVWLGADSIRIKTVLDHQGQRPWSRRAGQ